MGTCLVLLAPVGLSACRTPASEGGAGEVGVADAGARSADGATRVAAAAAADLGPPPPVEPLDAGLPLPAPPPIVPGRGLGGLQLGEPSEAVTRRFGPPSGVRAGRAGVGQAGPPTEHWLYREQGLDVEVAAGRVVALTLLAAGADPFFPRAGRGRSDDGLTVQSSPAQFARAWGAPARRGAAPSPFWEGGEAWSWPGRGAVLLLGRPADAGPRVMGLRLAAPEGTP